VGCSSRQPAWTCSLVPALSARVKLAPVRLVQARVRLVRVTLARVRAGSAPLSCAWEHPEAPAVLFGHRR
jgi:hypothetical protein